MEKKRFCAIFIFTCTILFILFVLLTKQKYSGKIENNEKVENIDSVTWQREVFGSLAIDTDVEWGYSVVENDDYIFYTTKNELIKWDKVYKEKTILDTWNKEVDEICLCCSEDNLYYIKNLTELYLVDLSSEEKEQICTSEMLEENRGTPSEMVGIKLYENKIYLKLTGFIVIEYDLTKQTVIEIAKDVQSGSFCDGNFFYTHDPSNIIYKVDLKTKYETKVREKKNKEYIQYRNLLDVNGKLYYRLKGDLYYYNQFGTDEKMAENIYSVIGGEDALYYVKMEDKVGYLYKCDIETKQSDKMEIQRISKEDNFSGRVVSGNLFFKTGKGIYEKKYDFIQLDYT